MAGERRAGDGEYAARVNAAVELLASGVPVAEAASLLGKRFGVSVRQARRYVEAAADGGVEVPEERVVFTVKLPASVAAAARAAARAGGQTISALVARALTEFLHPSRGKRPRR